MSQEIILFRSPDRNSSDVRWIIRHRISSAGLWWSYSVVSYENKTETSFKVFQVLGNAALATEASDKIGKDVMYLGNTAVILGENFYSDQIAKKNVQP